MITLSLFAFALLFFQQFAEARSGVFLEKLQEEYPECGPLRDTSDSKLGNGECDEGTIYNTAECNYDLGDCLISDYPDCHVTHPSQIGDGICNEEYNTLVCAFDGADCSPPEEGFDIDGNELRSSGETAGIVFGAMAIVSLILSSQYVFVRSRNNGNVVAAVDTNPRRISPSDAASVASWNPAALFYWAPLHAVRTDRRKKEERIALVMKSIIRKVRRFFYSFSTPHSLYRDLFDTLTIFFVLVMNIFNLLLHVYRKFYIKAAKTSLKT